jgi:hypothetical protein
MGRGTTSHTRLENLVTLMRTPLSLGSHWLILVSLNTLLSTIGPCLVYPSRRIISVSTPILACEKKDALCNLSLWDRHFHRSAIFKSVYRSVSFTIYLRRASVHP